MGICPNSVDLLPTPLPMELKLEDAPLTVSRLAVFHRSISVQLMLKAHSIPVFSQPTRCPELKPEFFTKSMINLQSPRFPHTPRQSHLMVSPLVDTTKRLFVM